MADHPAGTEIDVVETADRFTGLREEWTALLTESDADNLFVTWEWLYTCWRHLEVDAPAILVVRQRGTVIAIAPFVRKPSSILRGKLLRSLSMLGQGSVGSDYLDVIVRRGFEEVAVRAIVEWLIGRGIVAEFPRLREHSVAMRIAAALTMRGWASTAIDRDVAPFITLAGRSAREYLASLGPEQRHNFRRRLRGLEQRFAMELRAASTDEERRTALDVLMRLHNQRWAQRGGSTAFHTRELIAFHQEMSAIALSRGWLRLFVLWLDRTPVAALYGFVYGGKFYCYQSGFDEAYRAFSVGMVTTGLTIRAACDEGLAEYDLLHGAEQYKFLWARQSRTLTTLAVYPPRLGALCHRAGVAARRQAGRLVRRWQRGGADERFPIALPSNR